jgi:hypothetical protein
VAELRLFPVEGFVERDMQGSRGHPFLRLSVYWSAPIMGRLACSRFPE